MSEERVARYVHACYFGRADPRAAAVTGRADGWIRWTTIVCVALLALIAGMVSYLHMHRLVALHGEAPLARLADTAARASAALSWTGSYPAAFDLAAAALGRVASLDHNSGGVLALRFQRANAARYLGHLAAAETELGDVLTGRQRILGTDHRDTLTTQHYLAATLAGRGRLADAEAMLRQVLAKKLEILGPGIPTLSLPGTGSWPSPPARECRKRPRPNRVSSCKRGSRSWMRGTPVP